jgi:hypothetical protein
MHFLWEIGELEGDRKVSCRHEDMKEMLGSSLIRGLD